MLLTEESSQRNDEIAEDLYVSGEADGYDGVEPDSPEVEYLRGYIKGLRCKFGEVQAQLADCKAADDRINAFVATLDEPF
jgi:hypothetical protein